MRTTSATSLPLGVDLGPERISVVASAALHDGFAIRDTCSVEIPRDDDARDRTLAQALRSLVETLTVRERRCVLAVDAADVVLRPFRLPPSMRRREAERAAALEADSIAEWPVSERLVALDEIPGHPREMLLSVARNAAVERLVAIARAAGLRPVAVDAPACAWRRAVADADAVLDCSSERASLAIFGEPVAATRVFAPRLIDARLAGSVRAALVEARRDGVCDVERLAILAPRPRFDSLRALLGDDGYAIAPVIFAGVEAPPWALAFGLASWSIAPRGIAS